MTKITISLEAKFLIPTLNVYAEYFNNKYPCTDENNDGSNMSLEDEVKYATYNYLLNVYEKSKEIYVDAYNELKKKVSEIEVSVPCSQRKSIGEGGEIEAVKPK